MVYPQSDITVPVCYESSIGRRGRDMIIRYVVGGRGVHSHVVRQIL
jgi:hypothetical protein